MFINPEIVKTTTFLVSGGDPVSSVFFVEVPLSPDNSISGRAYYAVTTNHSLNGGVEIRFNHKGGGVKDVPVRDADWERDAERDIAVLPLTFPLHLYDIEWINLGQFAQDKDHLHVEPIYFIPPDGSAINKEITFDSYWQRYGIGDEVFSIGLFEGHSGQSLAQPAVRFGHIALKPAPGEKIFAEIDPRLPLVPMDAFLVEMAAGAGQSGSPVFLRPYPYVGERDHKNAASELNYMIGMVQGFYPGENGSVPMNMGIGIVIPSEKIIEALMSEGLKTQRADLLKQKLEHPKIRPSAARRSADE